MAQLSIEDDKDIGFLKLCSNVKSLSINYTRSAEVLKLNKHIRRKLLNSKELQIAIVNPNYDVTVVPHTRFLGHLEEVKITVSGIIYLNYLTTILNPKKLKILNVKAETINLLDFELLRTSFRNLITLSLRYTNFILYGAHRIANFHDLQGLSIDGKFGSGII